MHGGNGDGNIAPTTTGDHNGHVSDYTAPVAIGVDGFNQNLTGDKAQTVRGGRSCGDHVGMVILNNQGGNSIHVEKNDVSSCLRSQVKGHLPILCLENHPNDSRIKISDDNICQSLTSRMGTGGGNVPLILEQGIASRDGGHIWQDDVDPSLRATPGDNLPAVCLPAYCIQGNTIDRAENAGANGKGVNEDVSFTLNTTDRHAVAFDCRNHAAHDELSGTLQAKENGGYSLNYINPVMTYAMQGFGDYKESDIGSSLKSRDYKYSTDLISRNYAIRRLTPTECERLQGFPDGYTEFGVNPEKYRASLERGKKRTDLPENTLLRKISDAARYKALGNSVAIPCVDFILSGISERGRR